MYPTELLSQLLYLGVTGGSSLRCLIDKFIIFLLITSTTTCFIQHFTIEKINCRPETEYHHNVPNLQLSCLINGTGTHQDGSPIMFDRYMWTPMFFCTVLAAFILKTAIISHIWDVLTDWTAISTCVNENNDQNGAKLAQLYQCTLNVLHEAPNLRIIVVSKSIVDLISLLTLYAMIPIFFRIPISHFITFDWEAIFELFPVNIFCVVQIPSLANVNTLHVPCILAANRWYAMVAVFNSIMLLVAAMVTLVLSVFDIVFIMNNNNTFVKTLLKGHHKTAEVADSAFNGYIKHIGKDGEILIRCIRYHFGLMTATLMAVLTYTHYLDKHPNDELNITETPNAPAGIAHNTQNDQATESQEIDANNPTEPSPTPTNVPANQATRSKACCFSFCRADTPENSAEETVPLSTGLPV